jgi:flagellar L-ring protein precursor FlgH
MRPLPLVVLVLGAAALAGCNAGSRLQQLGETPPLTTIQDPHAQPGYRPVSLPMPAPIVGERRPNSLWQAGTRAFFKDQRASQVGDILTVQVNIDEKAKLDNETTRSRNNAESLNAPRILGFERNLQRILPSGSAPATLLDTSSQSNVDGKGTVDRKEQIKVNVAALVMQVLPNGNLVVQGRQEMRVNFEVRELQVVGVIRPQDISSTNTIPLEKLAEARVSYGGRGQITDVQQPRYGQQLFDIIMPF